MTNHRYTVGRNLGRASRNCYKGEKPPSDRATKIHSQWVNHHSKHQMPSSTSLMAHFWSRASISRGNIEISRKRIFWPRIVHRRLSLLHLTSSPRVSVFATESAHCLKRQQRSQRSVSAGPHQLGHEEWQTRVRDHDLTS